MLGPDGRLAARLAGWESRPQQLEMARLVAEAIRTRRHAVVENGTDRIRGRAEVGAPRARRIPGAHDVPVALFISGRIDVSGGGAAADLLPAVLPGRTGAGGPRGRRTLTAVQLVARGVRYRLPFLIMGIDLAQSLSESGRSPHLHLNFTPLL